MQCERDRSSVTYRAAVFTMIGTIKAETAMYGGLVWPCAVTDIVAGSALQGVHMRLVVVDVIGHVIARPRSAAILRVELELYLLRIVALDAKRYFIVGSSRAEFLRQFFEATFINLFALISETLTIRRPSCWQRVASPRAGELVDRAIGSIADSTWPRTGRNH